MLSNRPHRMTTKAFKRCISTSKRADYFTQVPPCGTENCFRLIFRLGDVAPGMSQHVKMHFRTGRGVVCIVPAKITSRCTQLRFLRFVKRDGSRSLHANTAVC